MNSNDLISFPPWWVGVGWVGYLLACVWLLLRAVGIRRFNTFSILLPLLLIMNGLLVPFSRNLNTVISGLWIDDRAFRAYWKSVGLLYFFLPLGVILANTLFRNVPVRNGGYLRETRYPTGSLFYLLALTLVSGLYLLKIYRDGLQLDILQFVRGYSAYSEYADHRYSFASATGGWDYFLYNKLGYAIAPMGVIMAWNWVRLGRLCRWLILGTLALCLFQTGHKLPLVFIGTLISVSAYAIRNRMHISLRFFGLLGGLGCAIIFGVVPLFYIAQGESTYASALWWSVERFAGESYRALQLYFYVYPQQHPHLWGTSQQTIAALAQVKDFVPVSIYIPREVLGLKDTSYPALFIGEAWADFGYVGVIGTALACGAILQSYNRWYYGLHERYLEDTALFVAVCISVVNFMHSNFITAFSTYGLGVAPAIYICIKMCGQVRRKRGRDPTATLAAANFPPHGTGYDADHG